MFDLIRYERVDAPRFKKNYEGQLLRVVSMPQRTDYSFADGECQRVSKPDPLVPDNSVMKLRRRYTYEKNATLVLDWKCPCCGHIHEREIPETMLAEGTAEFVKQNGYEPRPSTILYLATPYSHADPAVMQQRWLEASTAAAWLFARGFIVLAPVSMGHPIGVMAQEDIGHDFNAWEANSFAMLDAATHLVVYRMEGWEASKGVRAEIARSRYTGKPIWSLFRMGDAFSLSMDPEFTDGGEAA